MTTTAPGAASRGSFQICPVCHNPFSPRSGRGRQKIYCSAKCKHRQGIAAKQRRQEILCETHRKEQVEEKKVWDKIRQALWRQGASTKDFRRISIPGFERCSEGEPGGKPFFWEFRPKSERLDTPNRDSCLYVLMRHVWEKWKTDSVCFVVAHKRLLRKIFLFDHVSQLFDSTNYLLEKIESNQGIVKHLLDQVILWKAEEWSNIQGTRRECLGEWYLVEPGQGKDLKGWEEKRREEAEFVIHDYHFSPRESAFILQSHRAETRFTLVRSEIIQIEKPEVTLWSERLAIHDISGSILQVIKFVSRDPQPVTVDSL